MVSLNKIGLKLDGGSWPDKFWTDSLLVFNFLQLKAHLLVFMFNMLTLFG